MGIEVRDESGERDSVRRLKEKIEELESLIQSFRRKENRLIRLSITDSLTRLSNRRGYFAAAEKELRLARRNKEWFFVAFLDVDGFKQINDLHGHKEGDRVLQTVGMILRKSFRTSDVVGRLGGDEFAVAVRVKSSRGFEKLKIRFFDVLSECNDNLGQSYRISVSLGSVGCHYDEKHSLDDLLVMADMTLYEEKRTTRISRPSL